ncbi:MAG: hypothetical protein HY420_03405, partial [Candidatus Kerfeldbacteria bacterium]|nr:hypothetical protein [Candidatus Kerfeldbacteria bacterium]
MKTSNSRGKPLIAFLSVFLAVSVLLLVGLSQISATTGKSTYTHEKDGYSFSYPSTWLVKKGSKAVALTPPASDLASLKAKGVTYSATVSLLNNDSSLYSSALKKALKSSWKKFASAYATAIAKKNNAAVTTGTYSKTGWSAKSVTFKKKEKGIATTWRFVVMTKDKKRVYVVTEKWTKNKTSPFATDIKALIKSFDTTSASAVINWTFDGSTWQSNKTPPACANPVVIPSPVDLSLASSILYPGQYRGGEYKPHGGFRFDNSSYDKITVTVPLDGRVVSAARYIESGQVQYLFDIYSACGIRVRFDHLFTVSSAFQAIADQLPAPKIGDSRTTNLATPVVVKAGDVIGTAVGTPTNPFVDFGVYDLREQNSISSDADWASEHANEKEMGWYGACWLTMLPTADANVVQNLPASDQTAGKTSDYCTPVSLYQGYASYAGTWSGSWTNNTFGSTGSMTG